MCYVSLVWDIILSFVWGTLIVLMFHIRFACLKKNWSLFFIKRIRYRNNWWDVKRKNSLIIWDQRGQLHGLLIECLMFQRKKLVLAAGRKLLFVSGQKMQIFPLEGRLAPLSTTSSLSSSSGFDFSYWFWYFLC